MALSNEEVVQIWRDQKKIPLPYFGGKEVELFFEDEEEVLYFAEVIRRFLTLTPSERQSDTRHAYAYFEDFTDDVGFEWVDPELKHLEPNSEDIWRFVEPTTLGAMESWDVGAKVPLRQYVVVEANCGWEIEHGLLMSWRDGIELVKVSGYDGHATNGHAFGDLSKDRYIYHSRRAERCTMSQAMVPASKFRPSSWWPWKKPD